MLGFLKLQPGETENPMARQTGQEGQGQVGILDLTTGKQTNQEAEQAGQEGQESTKDRENK
jgi:hypothetical protein